jgi:hypothetical protein
MQYGGESLRTNLISNKKTLNLEKKKIVFQFILINISSFIAGILFVNILSDNLQCQFVNSIERYFHTPVVFNGFWRTLLASCLAELICILFLFAFSFSFINYLVTDFVLTFSGLKIGIYTHLCIISDIGAKTEFAVVFLKILLDIIILVYSCKIAIHSLTLKKFLSETRVAIRIVPFIRIAALTVITVVLTLIISAIIVII